MNRNSGNPTSSADPADDPAGSTPKLKDRHREATRGAILDAAEQVFVQNGFEAGRMEQVAETAGVSVGTLYNYFADRNALVDSLMVDRRAELLRRVDAALGASGSQPAEQLRAMARSVLEHVEAHRAFVTLLLHERATECGIGNPAMVATPSTTVLELQTRSRAVLDRARDAGLLPAGDPLLLSHLFTGLLRASILFALGDPSAGTAVAPGPLADQVVGTFLQGVKLS